MSSTNRGAVRSPNDFYVTDPDEVVRFVRTWRQEDHDAECFWEKPRLILDPSAGGLTERIVIERPAKAGKKPKPPLIFEPCEMSYPVAIERMCPGRHQLHTIDIRQNSKAHTKADFLAMDIAADQYDMVITNPPFEFALRFIQRALHLVRHDGYVVMLLRLNFFGSDERNAWFLQGNMPQVAYVHAKRLGFTPDGATDSIEYMHAIWKKTGERCFETKLRLLKY